VLGLDMLVPPPPSSAAVLITALNILAGFDLPLTATKSLGMHRCALPFPCLPL
jgi:hypothetical protein